MRTAVPSISRQCSNESDDNASHRIEKRGGNRPAALNRARSGTRKKRSASFLRARNLLTASPMLDDVYYVGSPEELTGRVNLNRVAKPRAQ